MADTEFSASKSLVSDNVTRCISVACESDGITTFGLYGLDSAPKIMLCPKQKSAVLEVEEMNLYQLGVQFAPMFAHGLDVMPRGAFGALATLWTSTNWHETQGPSQSAVERFANVRSRCSWSNCRAWCPTFESALRMVQLIFSYPSWSYKTAFQAASHLGEQTWWTHSWGKSAEAGTRQRQKNVGTWHNFAIVSWPSCWHFRLTRILRFRDQFHVLYIINMV